MKYIIYIFILFTLHIEAQVQEEKQGTVSYISSENIYVKFSSAEGINPGDTLFIKKGSSYIPAVIVKYVSTHSVAGPAINSIQLMAGDILFIKAPPKNEVTAPLSTAPHDTSAHDQKTGDIPQTRTAAARQGADVSGRLSVQSVSSFSNFSRNGSLQRWRYSFSLNADNVIPGISLSNYIIFNYSVPYWSKVRNNLFEALKIYDLAVKYSPSAGDEIWIGRHLNNHLSSAGSIDGIQYEKKFNSFYTGLILGSRPDYNNMGFNINFLQYGGYAGRIDTINNAYMDNNLSFIQQTNHSKTDRRFIYFQHSNNLIPGMSIFGSAEIDLYERVKGEAKNTFSFTGLFLSARYSIIKEASVDFSYDARKNVIYYETFKNINDSLFNRETRQGLRAGLSIRPVNYLHVNLNMTYRFQKSDLRPTRSFNGTVSYSAVPFIDASASVRYNRLFTSYLDAGIYSISLIKYIAFCSSSVSISAARSDYKYVLTGVNYSQDNINADISVMIVKKLFFSISWDQLFENQRSTGSIYTALTFRF